ncbi:unnamed protein product [Lactuca virosa]|uniref:Ubiquitin carboxyl-terminal hydrolase n=1 Tax=Lactuca virosa TaxID=75947 RepID=A0AAU9MID8_9ASTR|nr:unnamed protein product [Lactuca virosa]
MAETLSLIDKNTIVTQKPINRENPGGESTESLAPVDKSPFRRIEFHLARKPFTGFTKGGGDGSFRLETLNPTSTSSNNTFGNQQGVGLDSVGGGSSGKKRDASELGNGLDPELSFGITFRRIGAGLENLGNTCFLNSVLQCLTYTEPLAAYLQSGKHQVTCQKAGFCALCAIQKHVSCALQSSGRSLAPKDLVSNLRCISRTFRNSRQEDAHEYMVNLLESMHKCCLPTGVPSESQSAYDKSLVHKIFGGRLRSQVKCMQCNYCSNKFDPFLDLSLEILRADTLYKAFANFTAKEQLDGGAKQYQCQQCKQKVKALKQLTVHKAPNVLTVHLKRFGSHMSGQKIDKKIQFGSTLDLKPFVTGPYDGDLKYTLYGVLVHAGWSTHSGHYYCFVRTSSGMWYSLDDNRVYQVSEKKVFEQKAYMLFYFRDQKSFPSKKTTDVVHQKEKIPMNNGLSVSKETQKIPMSNGLCVSKETQKIPMINGSSVVPKETQISSNVQKETQISSNVQKETLMDAILSNGSSVTVLRNGFITGATEQKEKREDLVPKSSESSVNSKNGDFSVPIMNLGNAESKTDKGETLKENGGGESVVGGDGQKGAAVVAAMVVDTPDLPKMESLTNKEPLDQKPHKKAKNLPEMGRLTKKKEVDRKPNKKVKNFLKCKKIISMKFSANVLMGTSLNQRKKKKHKQSKKIKKLVKENLVNEGQPSSEKVKAQDVVKPPVDKEKSVNEGQPSSEKVKAQDVVKPPVENGFKERVNKDGAVLATNDLNGVSTGIQSNHLRENSTQKDLLHLLTRGLDDRIVPRWDEGESTTSHIRERKRDLTIGYIGDEWDDEYDRGKRKKVRISKTEFDGKNPFQDIANERLKSEKPNLSKRPVNMKNEHFKKSTSGRPFRI